MGWVKGVLVAMTMAGSGDPSARLVVNPEVCEKKRVDVCGCHHVYGARHCHPNRKSTHCEAFVQGPRTQELAILRRG
ncbi:MAG: hypothetical protein ACT4TC_09285 [Myxococcaceae bacterium]